MEKFNEEIELLIDLIEGALQKEGYKTMRYSETDKFMTTSYDSLVVRNATGNEFTISMDERIRFNKQTEQWEKTNDLK